MDEEVLIPFIVFSSMLIGFVTFLYFRHRSRMETQHTFRLALEKGSELSPEFMKQLGTPAPDKDRDLRRGLVWLALALGFGALGISIPDDEANVIMLGVAAFPFFIGLAFVIMYFNGTKKES